MEKQVREIKFKVWDIYAKVMRDMEYLSKYQVSYVMNPKFFIVLQYTGLKDKNGREIYEGDIVRACFDYGPGGDRDEVIAVTIGPWGVNIQQWNYEENRIPEVIGTIYENPELLK